MRPMMEGLEGRQLFAGTPIAASTLPTTITPALPVAVAGRTVLPNQVYTGNLKPSGREEIPLTVVFASTNGADVTATLTIGDPRLRGANVISAAPPTDQFIRARRLTNSLSVDTRGDGTIDIGFRNFVHPRDENGRFEAIARVQGHLAGKFSADGRTIEGNFTYLTDGNRTHGRAGTFRVTLS